MTFAIEAEKSASERFCLVKISPKKLLTGGVSLGGNNYQYDIGSGYLIDSIRVYTIDENVTFTYSAGVLIATSTTNLLANTVIMTHDLFITGTTTRYTSGISGVDDAEWQPYLLNYPSCSQSMRNIGEGVFSLSDTSISMVSDDRIIQKYLGTNDSFSLAPVKVWACINDVSINRVIFDGTVSEVSVNYGVATFQVLDSFQKMNDVAKFGTEDQAYISTGGSLATYPDMNPAPAPLTIGRSSPLNLLPTAQTFCTNTTTAQMYHVNISPNLVKNTPLSIGPATTSANFFVGRFVGTAIKKMTFGTVTRCYRQIVFGQSSTTNGCYPYTMYFYVQCSNFSGEIGDCISYGNSPSFYGFNSANIFLEGLTVAWVCRTQNCTGPDGQTYNFVASFSASFIRNSTSLDDSHGTPITSGLQTNPTLPDNYYYSYSIHRVTSALNFELGGTNATSYDYNYYLITNPANGFEHATPSVSSQTTIGGQNISLLYVTLNYVTLGSRYGSSYKDYSCRFSPNISVSHADAMKFIVQSSGLTTLDSTFTQADSDLDADVSMTFPLNVKIQSYLTTAQYLAKSTFGLLRLNESREVEYEIISNPTAAAIDGTRDETNILANSFSSMIQYQDIKSTINFTNPQLVDELSIVFSGPGEQVNSIKAEKLHGISKEMTYEHGLTSIANRSAAIAGYLCEPTIEYTSSTANDDLVSKIGDVISLTNNSVLESGTTIKTVITEINTNSTKSTIKMNEIRGVP